ncbi:hypothetical protein PRIPAC_93863 [Pristionchus pacificus]|uniref:Uncharacterized protein n=1 Tax=Pristionchus pacificus TaxID=54126 RepID=A0A2A6CDT1_PRIPA|nr:hypothetical protein PRIPAC_93863 [Pristionchus pacificus]|eukprot:PDM76203.1 hypothetical protein PRIPAC_39807 [Pristionchus pacificus]
MALLPRSLLMVMLAVQHSHGWINRRPRFRISRSQESYRQPLPRNIEAFLVAHDEPEKPIKSSYAIVRDLPPAEAHRRLTILNVTNHNSNERRTPCCKDTLKSGACQLMSSRDPDYFLRQCRTNADFSFIQCCASCHFAEGVKLKSIEGYPFATPASLYDHDVAHLLQSFGSHCADRRGPRYCEALATQNVLVANPKSSRVLDLFMRMPSEHTDLRRLAGVADQLRRREAPCEPTVLAFRLCRKTCGYCARSRERAIVKFDADDAQNPHMCQTLH